MIDHKQNVDNIVLFNTVESFSLVIIGGQIVSMLINFNIQNGLLEWHLESTIEALLLNFGKVFLSFGIVI